MSRDIDRVPEFLAMDRGEVQVNVSEDEEGRPFSPAESIAETIFPNVITPPLQTAGPSRNEGKPPKASMMTAEEGIPDKTVRKENVFPGMPSSWLNVSDWRFPKEEKQPERLLDYFEDTLVRMTYFKDPTHFYVVRANEYNECMEFCQKIGSAMSVGSEVYKPGSRNNLAVLRGDNSDTWKRLEVLEYIPNHRSAYVRFMDEGRTATINIPSKDVLNLDDSFKNEPGFAILCSLDIEPIGHTWPAWVLQALNNSVDKVIKVRCINQTWGFHVTHFVKILLRESNTDFGTMVIERGLARKRTDLPELELDE